MRHTPSITTTTLGIAIGCALAANFLTGCGNAGHASGTRTSPKQTIHVLVDRSHSTDAARGRQLAAAKNIHLKLAKAADIHFWAFDSKPIEVVAAGSTLTTKQLVVALGAEIAPQSADIRTITRPGKAIKAVADKASSGAPVSVILITDGDIDDAGDRPTLKAAVDRVIGNGSGGKLIVIGIDPSNRKAWEDILTPAAEQATTLATWAEASSALDRATKS
jgi:hypothetical protein